MSEWSAQTLQAVWFVEPRESSAASIFEGIVGAKPDNSQQMTVGSAIATGSNGTSQFQVLTQPGRIDYYEMGVAHKPDQFPVIADWNEALDAFAPRVMNGSLSVGTAYRLAIVVALCKPMETTGDALQALGSLIGAEFPFSDGQDILFQVNRRRPIAGRDDMSMNRLFRIQPQVVQRIVVQSPAEPAPSSSELVFISVDCNTHSASPVTLEPSEQIPIWRELAAEAARLCDARSIKALS